MAMQNYIYKSLSKVLSKHTFNTVIRSRYILFFIILLACHWCFVEYSTVLSHCAKVVIIVIANIGLIFSFADVF